MRILVAAERLGHAGGMERYLDVVLPALAARGATVHVLAREIDAAPASVTVQRVAWSEEHAAPDAAARAETARALEAFAPDVTVAHNVMDAGVVEALRAAPRFAYHVHDHRPFCPNGDRVFPRTGRICAQPMGLPCAAHALLDGCGYGPRLRTAALIRRRERLRDAIAAADSVVVASAYMAKRARDSGVPVEKLVQIPLPLPDDAYAAAVGASQPGAVVFAARIVPQKGLASLVRAVAMLVAERRPAIRALGDGPALAEARADAARLGVSLDAPGAVAPSAVRAAIDGAAFVVLPSQWAEPFGYVGIEAFARGRAVVAFDTGGVRAWLADRVNGLAVPAGDIAALSAAIDALHTDDDRRDAFGRRAREQAERYRADRITGELLSAYRPG
ncbi:MAG TPA: glycosyltransferase family 4 protein [Candidatus Elarobacter sp.]|nr:glycosyltransferase family 4 protein [Candidatus Elarobacter sp.]